MGYATESRIVELSLTSALLLTSDMIGDKSLTPLSQFPLESHGNNSTFPAALVRTRD